MIFLHHATNFQRARKKESVSKEQVNSMCTALLAMHVNIATHRLMALFH